MDRNVVGDVMGKALAEVALRKESVDRNDAMQIVIIIMYGRSPQGERG